MSLGTSNRDGGKTSESGHLRAIYKGFAGQVLNGLNVSQRGAGANMSVDIAVGDAILPRSDGTYGHPCFNDAVLNKTITTADPSNPRRDIVIMYVDYNVTPSTGVSNNTNGVVATAVVAGTPAGSPVDPNAAALQAAAGSGNPYIILARVRVAAGATSISNSVIDDLRVMAVGRQQGGWHYDPTYTWVYASASSFTIAGVDVTSQFPIGTKLAIYQSGSLKYFTVTSSSFSTNTTVNLDGGNVYSLTNVPLDKPAYSYMQFPSGFPALQAAGPFYNPYKFSVYRAAAANTGNNAAAKITFDTETFDTNNNFGSGTFTAPVNGFYHFNARFSVATSHTRIIIMLYVNGGNRNNGGDIHSAAITNGGVNISVMTQLAAGDTVEIYAYGNATLALEVGVGATANTYFNGYLVSRI